MEITLRKGIENVNEAKDQSNHCLSVASFDSTRSEFTFY